MESYLANMLSTPFGLVTLFHSLSRPPFTVFKGINIQSMSAICKAFDYKYIQMLQPPSIATVYLACSDETLWRQSTTSRPQSVFPLLWKVRYSRF